MTISVSAKWFSVLFFWLSQQLTYFIDRKFLVRLLRIITKILKANLLCVNGRRNTCHCHDQNSPLNDMIGTTQLLYASWSFILHQMQTVASAATDVILFDGNERTNAVKKTARFQSLDEIKFLVKRNTYDWKKQPNGNTAYLSSNFHSLFICFKFVETSNAFFALVSNE